MRSLGFNSSDEEEAASPTAAEPGSPVGAIKPPTPPGTWPLHLPPPEGACDAAKVYKFYHNAYTIKAGGMYDDNFLVAGVMLDDRDMAKPSAYLVMVEVAMPSKGVRLKWFDPEVPPKTTYNMTYNGASRLSNFL